MSVELAGFNVAVRDGRHQIIICNTERSGYVTFKDTNADEGIDLREEDFCNLVSYLDTQVVRIKKKMEKRKAETGFTIGEPKEKKKRGRPKRVTKSAEVPASDEKTPSEG